MDGNADPLSLVPDIMDQIGSVFGRTILLAGRQYLFGEVLPPLGLTEQLPAIIRIARGLLTAEQGRRAIRFSAELAAH